MLSLQILQRSIRDLQHALWPCVGYDVLFRLVTFIVLGPVSASVFRGLIGTTGRYAVGNHEILTYVLSPMGLAGVFVWGGLLLFTGFAEHAGLQMIGYEVNRGRRLSSLAALWATAQYMPRLLLLGGVQFGIFMLLATPFLAIIGITYHLLWSESDLYYLTTVRPREFWIGAGIAGIAGLVYGALALRLYLRWLLALPAVLIDNAGTLKALRLSMARTKGRNVRNFGVIGLWTGFLAVLGLLSSLVFVTGGNALLASVGGSLQVVIPLAAVLLAAHAAGAAILTFLGATVSALAIVNIDIEARNKVDQPGQSLVPFEEVLEHQPTLGVGGRLGVLFGLGVVALLASRLSVEVIASLDVTPTLEITAHRGDSRNAPENTLAAIRGAIESGAEYAEIDVQLSADGEVVLFHDDDLIRITGIPKTVRELTLEELRELDAGRWFGPAFEGERIPTLQETIELAGDRIKLNIELKLPVGVSDPEPLVAATLDVIERMHYESRCVISSLSYPALVETRRRNPSIPVGFIIFQAVGDPTRLNTDFLSVRSALATDDLIAAARRQGMEIHVWSISNPDQLATWLNRGVDNIITDFPSAMVARRAELADLNELDRLLLWYRTALAN